MNVTASHRIRTSNWRDDDLVPISALQHYAYCPRQCALIHVEQVWDENIYTLRGNRAHEQVDVPGGSTRDDVRTEKALPIYSDKYGIVGRADIVEFRTDGTPYPVEHKVGSRKARRADEIQLCAQALCLEEMFSMTVSSGALFYKKSQRRREVEMTASLRADTMSIIESVRILLQSQKLPGPVADSRCPDCSLIESCMPYIVERLQLDTGEDE